MMGVVGGSPAPAYPRMPATVAVTETEIPSPRRVINDSASTHEINVGGALR